MSQDRFDKLLAIVTGTDKGELTSAHNGRLTAMKAYNDRPGKETKANYDAARDFYSETVDRLFRQHFPEDAPAPEGERFKNRVQALNWLQSQGYKVSQGKFYNDCKAGFPNIHNDGTISRYQVMQYGQQLDIEKRSAAPDIHDRDRDESRKVKADADKAEMQAEEMRREMDQKWLYRDAAWSALAAIVGTLRDSLRHSANVAAPALVHLSAGDQQRAPEVYEGIEEMIFARAFNEVLAAGRIDGVFELKQETDE